MSDAEPDPSDPRDRGLSGLDLLYALALSAGVTAVLFVPLSLTVARQGFSDWLQRLYPALPEGLAPFATVVPLYWTVLGALLIARSRSAPLRSLTPRQRFHMSAAVCVAAVVGLFVRAVWAVLQAID